MTQVTPDRLMQFANAYSSPLMIYAALSNGVFDAMDGGARTPSQISAATGAAERGISSLLNGLTAIAVVSRQSDGGYELAADASAFLVRGKPGYRGEIFRHHATQVMPQWMHLADVVRTGKPASAANTETTGSAYFEQFVEALFPSNYPAAVCLAHHLELEKSTSAVRVLDIAAGSGVWGIALAQSSASVTVTAVDWPNVLPVARKFAAQFGLSDRLTTIAGDLHYVDVEGPYQIATLGHILHSEGEERSRQMLKKVFAALSSGGTIAIAEFVLNDDRTGPPGPLIFSVNMLVNSDEGDTFTYSQIRQWLEDAGFVNVRPLDVPVHSPLMLATKP